MLMPQDQARRLNSPPLQGRGRGLSANTLAELQNRARDTALATLGYSVAHVSSSDVMTNIDGVLRFITGALRPADGPHLNPSPEGEGLKG